MGEDVKNDDVIHYQNDKIKTLEKEIKKLKTLPFFPYPMNSGGRKDYGEFYLISHAWLKANYYPYEVYQQKYSYLEISKKENKSGATCFISVHCNAAVNQTAKGVEVLYCTGSTKGKQLAEIMQKCLIEGTGLTNRGIKPRDDLHVLKRTKAPAILIETAFISNPAEEKLLKESPEIFAAAIWEAIKIFKSKGLI